MLTKLLSRFSKKAAPPDPSPVLSVALGDVEARAVPRTSSKLRIFVECDPVTGEAVTTIHTRPGACEWQTFEIRDRILCQVRGC